MYPEATNIVAVSSDNSHQVDNAVRQITADLQVQRLAAEQRQAKQAAETQIPVLEASFSAAVQAPKGLEAVPHAVR